MHTTAKFSFNIDVERRVVKFKPIGLWRIEDAEAMFVDFMRCAKNLGPHAAWFLLVDARDWATQPDDVQKVIVRCMDEGRRVGLQRSARIVNPSVLKLQLDRLGSRSPMERQDFADEGAALDWLLRPFQ